MARPFTKDFDDCSMSEFLKKTRILDFRLGKSSATQLFEEKKTPLRGSGRGHSCLYMIAADEAAD